MKFGSNGLKAIGEVFAQTDRVGVPGINAVIVPFDRKDEYNAATTKDDSKGVFAGDIVGVLTALGTPQANIDFLAGLVVTSGDQLRLDTNVLNSGAEGGTGDGGFPNGRRLADDVIDTILSVVTDGGVTSDNVPANDIALGDTFPFLGHPQQPRDAGVLDDNTRN